VTAEERGVEAGRRETVALTCRKDRVSRNLKEREKDKVRLTPSVRSGTSQHISRIVLESIRVLVSIEWSSRFRELNHRRLKVVERSFDQTFLLLVMSQEVVP